MIPSTFWLDEKYISHQKATIPGEIAIRDKNWHQQVTSPKFPICPAAQVLPLDVKSDVAADIYAPAD
jgi:hypothetical protein